MTERQKHIPPVPQGDHMEISLVKIKQIDKEVYRSQYEKETEGYDSITIFITGGDEEGLEKTRRKLFNQL